LSGRISDATVILLVLPSFPRRVCLIIYRDATIEAVRRRLNVSMSDYLTPATSLPNRFPTFLIMTLAAHLILPLFAPISTRFLLLSPLYPFLFSGSDPIVSPILEHISLRFGGCRRVSPVAGVAGETRPSADDPDCLTGPSAHAGPTEDFPQTMMRRWAERDNPNAPYFQQSTEAKANLGRTCRDDGPKEGRSRSIATVRTVVTVRRPAIVITFDIRCL